MAIWTSRAPRPAPVFPAVVFLAAAVLVVGLGGPARGSAACGPARVVDGDTLVQDGTRIRLLGIDSPERGRPWSAAAAARLRGLASAGLCCAAVARDRYGRRVAICRAGDRDVGQVLVREGLARAVPRFSRRYLPDERAARLDRVGLWSGHRAARTE